MVIEGEVQLFGYDFAEMIKQHEEKGIEAEPEEIVDEEEDQDADSDHEDVPIEVPMEVDEGPKLSGDKIKDI